MFTDLEGVSIFRFMGTVAFVKGLLMLSGYYFCTFTSVNGCVVSPEQMESQRC